MMPNEIAGMEMEIVSITLTPAELENVSGLSTTLQRVWRRRGEIPERKSGHASFSVHDAASISIAVALNRFGHSPAESMAIGQKYAVAALRCAMAQGGACEVIGTRENVRKFSALFNDDLSFVAALVGEQNSEFLRFLYSFDGEAPRLSDPYLEKIDELSNVSGYFVNLQAVGVRLLTVADRPLFKIRLGSKDVDKIALINNRI
ncbi:hypothetical protein [Rhizobium sullae]|nr:hypothetical protein [Rhizobium sullae]